MQKIADGQGQSGFSQALTGWKTDLEGLKTKLTTVDGLTGLKDRSDGRLAGNTEDTLQRPAKSHGEDSGYTRSDDTLDAQTFLTTAQLRLADYREAMRKNKAAEIAAVAAKAAYDVYCEYWKKS